MHKTSVENELDHGGSDQEPHKRKSIQSVEFGIRVLEAFMLARSGLALREVAEKSGMSRSQTHRYLLSYVRTSLVRQDPATGLYELGPLAMRIGLAALNQCEPVAVASDVIAQLTEQTGYSGLVLVWGDHGPTIVRLKRGRLHCVMSIQVGSVMPTLTSSSGQVFLAYLPRAQVSAAVREEWRQSNPENPNGWKSLFAKFEHQVRELGFCSVSGTTIPGLAAISAPVLDSQGDICAAITLVARESERLAENKEVIAALVAAAETASNRLGFQPDMDLEFQTRTARATAPAVSPKVAAKVKS